MSRETITGTSTVEMRVLEGKDEAHLTVILHESGDTLKFSISGSAVRELAAALPAPERVASVRRLK